jgi:hypothetical protein
MMAIPFIREDNKKFLPDPNAFKNFVVYHYNLYNFGSNVKIIDYITTTVYENEVDMFKLMIDTCPNLTKLIIVSRMPESVLRVLDYCEEVNPLPFLQELSLIHRSMINDLFESLYASVIFKFHSTLKRLSLSFTEESEDAAASYGDLYQYTSQFTNLKELYCGDSEDMNRFGHYW